MDDVLGVVVLAVRDEDLLAVELERPVALRHGPRADRGQVGARLWLGQVHGAGPLPAHHVRQIGVLQRLRAAQLDRLDRALRQQRTQVEGEIGRVPHLLDRRADELRQALPAEVGRFGEPVPAVFAELQIRILESGRGFHRAVVKPARAFAVSRDVERVEYVGREFRGFFENRRDHVRRGFLESRQRRHLVDAGDFGQHEVHFGERGAVGAHGDSIEFDERRAGRLGAGRAYPSADVSSGMIWNRSPTSP